MNYRFWGIKSLLFVFLGLLTALITLFADAFYLGLTYLAILLVCPLLIIYFYCSKCLCDGDSCSHYFLGKISESFPDRKGEKYYIIDYAVVFASVMLLLLFPQFVLIKYRIWFILFWILNLVALVEILLFVCGKCKNKKCLICRNKD